MFSQTSFLTLFILCFDCDVCIYAVNHGIGGKTIPELFGSLLSLKGLFLGTLMFNYNHHCDCDIIIYIDSLILLHLISSGGNQLIGTIPSELGSIHKLQMLWLGKCYRRKLVQVPISWHRCNDMYLKAYMFVPYLTINPFSYHRG